MTVKYDDLWIAFEFANSSGGGEGRAFVCRSSGEVHLEYDYTIEHHLLPDDLDDEDKYVRLPHKRDLSLGKRLVLSFVLAHMPEDYDRVRDIFGRRGAYGQFKRLTIRRRVHDQWLRYEASATEAALREWCAREGIEISD